VIYLIIIFTLVVYIDNTFLSFLKLSNIFVLNFFFLTGRPLFNDVCCDNFFRYYLANKEYSSEVQHVYRVHIDLEHQLAKPECLTCNTGCTFNKALFSEKNTYYAHICTGPNIPYVNIMKTVCTYHKLLLTKSSL